MEKQKKQSYYLGVDIGTDSVGYATTDETYSLLKFHGEPMWGVTLFDEAELNADRRMFRTSRRRLARSHQRLLLLQELFSKEIAKVDSCFFKRLQASRLYRDEINEGTIFPNEGTYTDKDYHKQYPTIHHLIFDLMENDAPHDVRLVYLACAWIISHRGHFLNEINIDNIADLTDFATVFGELSEYICQTNDSVIFPWKEDVTQIGEILKQHISVTKKYAVLCEVLFGTQKAPKDFGGFPYRIDTFLKLLCGSTVKICELFENEEYADVGSFNLSSDDDKIAELISKLSDEDATLIIKMKAVNDCILLVNSLDSCASISESKIKQYEQHKKDLASLKKIIRKYKKEQYKNIFESANEDNYTAYAYHCKTKESICLKKVDKVKFNDYLKKILNDITPEECDKAVYDDMLNRVALHTFMPKQKDGDNRVIPHQLYQWELRKILGTASKYLCFIMEADENGFTIANKIEAIFSFKIPYYVGPLNSHSERAWFVRKPGQTGKILPWNFSDVVDEEASEQEFIRRMTNRCTYMPCEDVLPKDSLLYHRFMVLNEINNLEINGQPISIKMKQDIYNDLFMNRRKVTVKAIRDYLVAYNHMQKNDVLTGIDETIKSDLKPWLDFKRLMNCGALTEKQVEDIIEHRTYAEEKTRFIRWLYNKYSFLSDEDLSYISKLTYKDFGRMSRNFLNGLEGMQKETGEILTIINAMWNTNCNLMELLSENYTYVDEIRKCQEDFYGQQNGTLNDRLDEMYVSNAVKRPIIRTLEIVKEVTKAVGTPPTKIFVEMARGGKKEDKGKRTKSRYQQILELYEQCNNEDVCDLRRELESMGDSAENKLQGDRLFLYYMQLGKCLYSGEAIDLQLLGGTTYNIEHIYPQAYVKDDSILNNIVLVKSELNGEKNDSFPIAANIRHKMAGYWSFLHDKNLLTDEKYKRLTRTTPFSNDEKWGFINRQLTETTQSTKAIATLLKEYYPTTEIVYVKARLTSEFRQEFDLLKSRTFNDLHHAKDAYLNIVAGNVYQCKFTNNFNIDKEYSVKIKTLFTHQLKQAHWDGEHSVAKVKSVAVKNTAHLTKYEFCRHGGFFDQMPVKAAEGLIPLKKDLPTEKYGGYNKSTISFFVLTKYSVGKKNETMMMSVELLHCKEFFESEEHAKIYAKQRIGQIVNKKIDDVVFPLGMRMLKINTILSLDGFRVCIAGSASGGKCIIASPFMPFFAEHTWETYIKRLEVLCEKVKNNPKYVADAFYDRVTKEKNMELYSLYIAKLTKSIYAKRPNNPVCTLLNGNKMFESLGIINQAQTLLNIHQTFGRISGGLDLTSIGGAAHAGATVNFSTTLSNWKKLYSDVRIIDSSVSGLWEKQSENLLSLT